jgi:hypothetical protein
MRIPFTHLGYLYPVKSARASKGSLARIVSAGIEQTLLAATVPTSTPMAQSLLTLQPRQRYAAA